MAQEKRHSKWKSDLIPEKEMHSKGDQTLKQEAQRNIKIFIFGNILDLAVYYPEQPVLASKKDLLLAGTCIRRPSEVLFNLNNSQILRKFCSFVNILWRKF